MVGPPGMGKTRVCAEVGDGVLFVEPADEGRLLDDLRELEPRVVVVDDAHDRARELTVLQRARVEEGLRFVIVAVTWSDQADAVESVVPGATKPSNTAFGRSSTAPQPPSPARTPVTYDWYLFLVRHELWPADSSAPGLGIYRSAS